MESSIGKPNCDGVYQIKKKTKDDPACTDPKRNSYFLTVKIDFDLIHSSATHSRIVDVCVWQNSQHGHDDLPSSIKPSQEVYSSEFNLKSVRTLAQILHQYKDMKGAFYDKVWHFNEFYTSRGLKHLGSILDLRGTVCKHSGAI